MSKAVLFHEDHLRSCAAQKMMDQAV